jgi:hypothetical protein
MYKTLLFEQTLKINEHASKEEVCLGFVVLHNLR